MLRIFTIFTLSSNYLSISLAYPSKLFFCGYFNVMDNNYLPDPIGSQHLASFLMAINDINNRNDGVYDWLLPDSRLIKAAVYNNDQFLDIISAESIYDSPLQGLGKYCDVIIGPRGELATRHMSQIFGGFSFVNIGYGATSSTLSDTTKYPLFSRTSFSDADQGYALAYVVSKQFGWSRISVFSSTDSYGINTLSTFLDAAVSYNIDVVSTHNFLAGTTDYTTIINSAKSAKTYIFVFIMSAHDAGLLLEQGYNAGLFREGTQVIGGDRVVTEETYQSMSSQAKVPTIMKGVLGITPYFGFDSPQGQAFVKRWRAQRSTSGYYDIAGNSHCDNSTDDASNYLYQYSYPPYTLCTGLDFSSFASDGSDIDGLAASVYDATFTAALALHSYIYNQSKEYEAGTNQYGVSIADTIVNNVSFTGLTGRVSFVGGPPSNNYRGNRKSAISYNLLNFNAAAYYARNVTGSASFVPVGRWVLETGFKYCSGSKSCNAIQFNTADNSVPKDRPDTVIVSMSAAVKGALIALSALCALIVLGFLVMTVYFREERVIRSAQPPMLYVMLVGGFLGAARVLLGSMELSDTICIVNVWCGHLCFGLVFAALISKTWVVNKLVNSGLKRVKVSKKDTVINLFAVLGILVVFLAIITALGKPYQKYEYTYDGDVPYRSEQCVNSVSIYSQMLLVVEVLTVLVGGRLAWAIRNVPDAVNESKFIFSGKSVVEFLVSESGCF